jgi:uncharacterized protein (DUF433 family)
MRAARVVAAGGAWLYPSGVHAFDLGPAPITKDEDGVLRVAGTRVTLDSIVAAFDLGATPEEIVQRYPSVDLASAYVVIAYVLRHRESVDLYLTGRSNAASDVQAEVEARFPPDGLRARLLARRPAGQ